MAKFRKFPAFRHDLKAEENECIGRYMGTLHNTVVYCAHRPTLHRIDKHTNRFKSKCGSNSEV